MANVGKQIETLIKLRGISLTELADRAGISKGHLWQLVHGEQPNPSLDILEKIARALETTLGEVLGQKIVGKGAPKLPSKIPEDLQKFLDIQRDRGNLISDDDVALLSQIRFRTQKPVELKDWDYIYRTIELLAGPGAKRRKK
jgi:transcriptional regulator with XRE-family HTH domain